MTNLSKAVEMLSNLLANVIELPREEYFQKLIKEFYTITGYSIEITKPGFRTSLFNHYNYLVKNENIPVARIYIDEAEPTDEIIQLVSLIGVLIKNKLYYDNIKAKLEITPTSHELKKILSYSEAIAVKQIFADYNENPWDEKNLIASKIADSKGVTRSVVVNAMKKMQMTGILTTRSCGMKGTVITVMDKGKLSKLLKVI